MAIVPITYLDLEIDSTIVNIIYHGDDEYWLQLIDMRLDEPSGVGVMLSLEDLKLVSKRIAETVEFLETEVPGYSY